MTGCKSVPHGESAVSGPKQKIVPVTDTMYMADTGQSYIRWTGSRPGKKHYGTLHLRSGSLAANNNNITGGRFAIDVASLRPEDQRSKGNELLGHHLLGEDFFDVKKFPVILFEIASVERKLSAAMYMVTGNLQLRDVVKSISFPAKIHIENGRITADADFYFNRTDWGLNYGNDKSLGNWFIRPSVKIGVHLVAKKI